MTTNCRGNIVVHGNYNVRNKEFDPDFINSNMTKSRTELKYSYPKQQRETIKCNTSTFKAKTNIKENDGQWQTIKNEKARDGVTTALYVPVKPVSIKINASERISDKRDPSVMACRSANSSYGDPARRGVEPRSAEKLQTRANLTTGHYVPLSEGVSHQPADASHHSEAGRYHRHPHDAGRYHRYPHDAGRYHSHPHDAGRYHRHPHTSIRYHSNEFPDTRFTNFRQHSYTSRLYQRLGSRQRNYFHGPIPGFHSRYLPNTNIHHIPTQRHNTNIHHSPTQRHNTNIHHSPTQRHNTNIHHSPTQRHNTNIHHSPTQRNNTHHSPTQRHNNTSYDKDNVNKTQKKDDSRKSFEHIWNRGVTERDFKSNLSWHTPVTKIEVTQKEKLTKSEKDAKVDKIRVKLQNFEINKKETNREREIAVKCENRREKTIYKQSDENVINRGQMNLGKCESKVSWSSAGSSAVNNFTPSSRSVCVSDTKNANVEKSHKSGKIREKLKKRKKDPVKVLGRHMVTCSYVMEDKVVDTCPLGHTLDPALTSFNITTGRLTAFCTSCNIKIYMNQTWTPEL